MYKMKTKKNTKSKNRKSLKNKLQKGGAGPYVPPHARRANPSHASRTSQPSPSSNIKVLLTALSVKSPGTAV